MTVLSSNLRVLRKSMHYTQAALAKEWGIERPRYGAWEEGRATPKLEMLVFISHFYGVTVDALISEEIVINNP